MTFLQIAVLAIIQGLTEFLPISSSAHLILVSRLSGWPDQGLVLDVAVHLGTLVAVVFYFRRELADMAGAILRSPRTDAQAAARRLGLIVAVSSIPVLLAGWLIYDLVATFLRDVRVIAIATLFFGVLLWLADRWFSAQRDMRELGWRDGLAIGLAQVLALIPGTSRSGVTIMMGRMLGFGADSAARFSFLLSIPVIGAAGAHGVYRLLSEGGPIVWQGFVLGVVLAAVAGWLCIAAFLALLQRVGLLPFIVYRLLLGVFLLYWLV